MLTAQKNVVYYETCKNNSPYIWFFCCVCVCVRSMMSQITAHEENVSEYTDKIAVMEEELKKVREHDFRPQTRERRTKNMHF